MILSRSLASVRPMGPYGIGRPYILDYKRGILKPDLRSYEWGRTRDGRVWAFDRCGWAEPWERVKRCLQGAMLLPTMELNFGFSGQSQSGPYFGYPSSATYTVGTVALSTAYIYGTSGIAVYTRIAMIEAKTFDIVFFYISSYTGTAANVNDLTIEVRNDTAGKPGTTVHASVVVDPASATGWIAATVVDGGAGQFAGSANTVYWLVVGDPDGNATDNAVVARSQPNNFYPLDQITRWGLSVTGGFATAPGHSSLAGMQVAKYTSGAAGIPFVQSTASTSSTNQRGLNISTGLTETLKVFGIVGIGVDADMTGVNIFSGAALPEDATAGTFTVQMPTTTEGGFVGTPYTIPKETQTRFVCVFSGTSTIPQKLEIGTGTAAGLRSAMLGGGEWYWAEADQTDAPDTWDNDDINAWPRMALLVENQVAVTGASGPIGQQCGM